MMGFWYVVQYYASSEEAAEYSCMKCNFSISTESAHVREWNINNDDKTPLYTWFA